MEPICAVLDHLSKHEHHRLMELERRHPQAGDLARRARHSRIIDPVPRDELAQLLTSSLTTGYQIWALAVRSSERIFVFWTYVAAHCAEAPLRMAAEQMAREAMADGHTRRRERRIAWRAERDARSEILDDHPGALSSAALLESLLFKEVVRWTRMLPAAERPARLVAAGYGSDQAMMADLEMADLELPTLPGETTLTEISSRAVRYAEQLSEIYLDEADRATDQTALDLAQRLASVAIKRMATLRVHASADLAASRLHASAGIDDDRSRP